MTDYEALEKRLVWSSMNIVNLSDAHTPNNYQVLDADGSSISYQSSMAEAIAWCRGWMARDMER